MNGNGMNNGSANGNGRSAWASVRMLLRWGVGIKRWLALGGVGIAVLALGLAYLLVKVFLIRPTTAFPAA
ncbi:MAG: hypothetical protein FJ317_08750, partial [SAR202 cluster bacterium]|nr:hypothetical protein [SAR202 cluster bacterium]